MSKDAKNSKRPPVAGEASSTKRTPDAKGAPDAKGTPNAKQAPSGKHTPPRVQNPARTIARLFRYMRYETITVIIALILVGIASYTGVVSMGLINPILNTLIQDKSLANLAYWLVILAAVGITSAFTNYVASRLLVRSSVKTTNRLRNDLFHHIQFLPMSYIDSRRQGDLMSLFTNDIDNVEQSLGDILSDVVRSLITFVSTLVMMFILSPILTLITIGMALAVFVLVTLVASRSARAFRARQADLAHLNGFVEEMISGQKVVQVFNHEEQAEADFADSNDKLFKSSTRANTLSMLMYPLIGNLSFVQFAVIAMVGSAMVINGVGGLDVGILAAMLQYTRSFSRPIVNIAGQFNVLVGALAGAERIFAAMDEPLEIDEGNITVTIDGDGQKYWTNSESSVPVRGDLVFENVKFSYEPGKLVINDISLYARPGQRIALVGSTGAGKTTLANLINRFYEIDSGRILIDGIDIREIKKHDLRGQLGMVLQDIHLFDGTIMENIRYGRLDATDAEVVAAAKAANAHYFIMQMPDGYDTVLSEDADNLSIGQRQLLSIARVAVSNPVVMILDEATSSVDTITERQISHGMDSLMEGRTVLAIAHRLSTVYNSNAILIIEGGVVIERGDHDDLMARKGRYYELNTGLARLT